MKTPEMNNKPNMTHTHQQINLHYVSQNHQMNHGSDRQKLPAKCMQTGKVNSIDNQRVTPQNT